MPHDSAARAPSQSPHPVGRPPQDHYARRRALYARAAPLFRQLGYRMVTLKALARACGMSIPALYRYFPSKRAFALFPLTAVDPSLHRVPTFPPDCDPLLPLRHFVDAAAHEMPQYMLAVALLREIDPGEVDGVAMAANVGETAAVLAAQARAAAPALGETAARELASAALALVVGPALVELGTTPDELRRQLRALFRAYLVPAGTDPAHLEAMLGADTPADTPVGAD